MRWLSPLRLILAGWGLTAAIAVLALNLPERFDLLPVFMAREAIGTAEFTLSAAVWLMTAMLCIAAGDLAGRVAPYPAAPRTDLNKAARITCLANLLLLGVTLAWVASAAGRIGGARGLATLALADSLLARDLLLENKLFTGMRLFYAALPATGALAAAILTAGRGRLEPAARRACRLTLALNAAALVLLPIVMSQRLLLLQFLLSAYLAACAIRGGPFGLGRVFLAVALFLGVWTLRESLTNPSIQRGALDLGVQKLAFYFVNDLWNAFAPLSKEVPATLGANTVKGLMFLTFTDGIFADLLDARLAAAESVRGGGEFPLLTAPLVDFGVAGGAAFLMLLGYALRRAHARAGRSLAGAAIYGQVGAALLFSAHGLYLTHQNFLVSLLIIAAICRLARARASAPASAAAPDQVTMEPRDAPA